jgi:hypothetical protein
MTHLHKTSTAPSALSVYEPKVRTPEAKPLTVTIPRACQISGYGPTTIWQLVRDGRLEIVRVAGIRRTLIIYDSLERLLAPARPSQTSPRRRGRPRKGAHGSGAVS